VCQTDRPTGPWGGAAAPGARAAAAVAAEVAGATAGAAGARAAGGSAGAQGAAAAAEARAAASAAAASARARREARAAAWEPPGATARSAATGARQGATASTAPCRAPRPRAPELAKPPLAARTTAAIRPPGCPSGLPETPLRAVRRSDRLAAPANPVARRKPQDDRRSARDRGCRHRCRGPRRALERPVASEARAGHDDARSRGGLDRRGAAQQGLQPRDQRPDLEVSCQRPHRSRRSPIGREAGATCAREARRQRGPRTSRTASGTRASRCRSGRCGVWPGSPRPGPGRASRRCSTRRGR
jgi:hypothetical protein